MRLFSLLLIASLSQFSFAAYDISCFEEDCLTQGWEVTNEATGFIGSVECVEEDCRTRGWLELGKATQLTSSSRCFFEDCFGKGWEVFNAQGQMVYSVRCQENSSTEERDCLTGGWIVMNHRGETISQTTCMASDCSRYGWDIELFNGNIQVVRCKDESCFTSGWTLRP